MQQSLDRRDLSVPRKRLLLVLVYFVGVCAILMSWHIGLVPDVLVLVLAGAALVAGRPLLFLRDWGVFLLIVVLWQQTGPLAQWVGLPLHMRDLVQLDRWLSWPLLHGQLPQEWLQQHLYHPAIVQRTRYHAGYWSGSVYHPAWWDHRTHPVQWQWYDIMSAVLYGLHFPEPLVVGFVIWLRDRALFRRFAAAYLALAGLAFVGYIVYPAVPPWMASYTTFQGRAYGAIAPPLHKIFDDFNYYVQQVALGHRYVSLLNVAYNRTAAMPSLHAAFPVLSACYLRKSIGRWGWLLLIYAGAMWFAVVYMGEHWVSDVLVGILCAIVAYVAVESVARYRTTRTVDVGSQRRLAL